MPLESVEFIEDLTRSDLNRLTQLLACKTEVPTAEWLAEQERDLSSFPPQLKRPRAILPRLIMALDAFGPRQAFLCSTHHALNPYLIHRLFVLLTAETTTRVKRLRGNPHLPGEARQFVQRLTSVNSLWMAPELYSAIFSVPDEEDRFVHIPGGCEACILAAVGGKPRIVADLRASIIGRKKRNRTEGRLLPILNAWISLYVNGNVIMEESHRLGKEVRLVRKQMRKARIQARRDLRDRAVEALKEQEEADKEEEESGKEEEVEEGSERDEQSSQDFEGSIIDFYANLMSQSNLAPSSAPTEDIHPAFRNSLAFDSASGTFHRQIRQQNAVSNAYSASVYSQPVHESVQSYVPQNSSAEAQAREYRRLVEIEEEEPNRRGHNHGKRRHDTTWSTFLR